jgi:lysozyme family protein
MSFEQAFKEVVGLEGVYSNDPSDPGNWTGGTYNVGTLKGTKYGVSAKAYPDLDIEALTLEQAQAIYHRDYWEALRCDDLSGPVASILFKQAVNQGVRSCAIRLQKVLNLSTDGVIGIKTIAAANSADPKTLVVDFLAESLLFYTTLPTWGTYGRGWTRRVLHTAIGAFT